MSKWTSDDIVGIQRDKYGAIKDGKYLDEDAYQRWYERGILHRKNGPAVIGLNGYSEWWFEGKKHRENGPALDWKWGEKEWFIHGIEYTEEEFNQYLENKKLNQSLNMNLDQKVIKPKMKI